MVSSKDVAKVAGVSQSTVSRVMNNPNSVKEEKRLRVLQVMEELDYRPNSIARSLVMNRTKTIALISGDLSNPFFVDTTKAIVNLATLKGYNIMVYFENAGDNSDIYESVQGHKVDGIILSSIKMNDPVFEYLENCGIPYMLFNRKHCKGGNYVVLDNLEAGRIAAKHLVDLGHTRIGLITGPTDLSTFYERKQGYFEVLKQENICENASLLKIVDTTKVAVEKATVEMMNMKNSPTAILCTTDHMAIFCMDTLLSLGMSIPDDVSLIGIDDVEMAGHHSLQLTTVSHYKDRMGELAMANLISMIEEGNNEGYKYKQIILNPHLVVRKTTKKIK